MSQEPIRTGAFVKATSGPSETWGVGKVVEATLGHIEVEYFDDPGQKKPNRVQVPAKAVVPVALPTQTRVYRRDEYGRWHVGRVLNGDGESLLVQFPNKVILTVRSEELYVRWARPLVDPLALLAAETTETPFLADARSQFIRQASAQRAASGGVTALLSSGVELAGYQFDVVRRVLTDPVPRYLLADEVGLGKTIEAGIIIRQYFLDDPSRARALVIAPPSLVGQWRTELASRFGLHNELDDHLLVIRSDQLPQIASALPTAGLLVVDEAHHLARRSVTGDAPLYDLLRKFSQQVSRLLLLSATPVLSDEEGFLRVLHLLDPIAFPLDDLPGFQKRIANRQLIAEIAALLLPENMWGLAPELDRLESQFGEDPQLNKKVAAVRSILERFPAEEDEEFVASLASLRSYLGENYRLHRRLLRNRRDAVAWATPRRDGLTTESYLEPGSARFRDAIERFRLMLGALPGGASSTSNDLLRIAVSPRSARGFVHLLSQAKIADVDLFAEAIEIDASLKQLRESPARFQALKELVARLLRETGAHIVVFCDTTASADRAMDHLVRSLGRTVVRHCVAKESEDDDRCAPWIGFLTGNQIRVLVCDRSAEEGINLHGGHKIAVHFDLPLEPNRIEQRLGRLDRFGTGSPVHSYALLDQDNPEEAVWLEALQRGWRVYDRSVASLQYLIESEVNRVAREWQATGLAALTEHVANLSGEQGLVRKEWQRIYEQDALDSLGDVREGSFEALEEVDSDWRNWRTAVCDFAIGVLGFAALPHDAFRDNNDTPFRFRYQHLGRDRPTLIPLANLVNDFLSSLDIDAPGSDSKSPQTHSYVFRRPNALSKSARAEGHRLLRVGDPFANALEQVCANDDRGRTFAVWRQVPDRVVLHASGADLYFRFDFIVRPALKGVEESPALDRANFARKAGTFMSPQFHRIWLDGASLGGEFPMEVLERPYEDRIVDGRRDTNLNPSRWRHLPEGVRSSWMRDWPSLCAERRDRAQDLLRKSEAYQSQVAKALDACAKERTLRRVQGESRLSRLSGDAYAKESSDMARDDALYGRLLDALREPELYLDVVGAIFLSTNPPLDPPKPC